MDGAAPSKSRCQIGCTDYAGVNPDVHMYVRGKQSFIHNAHSMLCRYIATLQVGVLRELGEPLDRTLHTVRADFNGVRYGTEYLVVKQRDTVVIWLPPELSDDEGWAYVLHTQSGLLGWLPAAYIT